VLAARRRERASVITPKLKVRYVKFTPEEMAYDIPPDTSDPKRFPTLGRGPKDWKKFMTFRNGFIRIDPKLRKAFPDDRSVNAALQKVIELRAIGLSPSHKRSA
jgi:hypothetical protein